MLQWVRNHSFESVAKCDQKYKIFIDEPDKRILGDTQPGEMRKFQFIVSIRRTGTNLAHLGSGALIGPTWVISASSLTSLFVRPADMTIAFGVINVPTVVAPGFTAAAQEFATNEG